MIDFDKTSYTDFALARNEFLRLAEAPTESLSLIIIYYTFEYTYFARVTVKPKKPIKGSTLAKLVKRT